MQVRIDHADLCKKLHKSWFEVGLKFKVNKGAGVHGIPRPSALVILRGPKLQIKN